MPNRHFYLLRHHILFYIKFLLFCSLAPDEIRILSEKIRGFPRREYFLLNCIEVSKEKRIFISLILFRCAKRSILPNKAETSEKAVRSFYGQNSAAQSHKIQ